MELRVLRYFVAVADEGNMTRASKKLLVSQPALSRQIADLEEELGVKLFDRKPRNLQLTSAGRYLYQQAKEILTLAEKTALNLHTEKIVSGDLTIAAGETLGMLRVTQVASQLLKRYPQVQLHLLTGDYAYSERKVINGTADFGVIVGNLQLDNFNRMQLPEYDRWGVLMPADDALAQKSVIYAKDLLGRKLLKPQQAASQGYFDRWFGNFNEQIKIVGTFNLNYNASLLVKEHTALIITLEHMHSVGPDSNLAFRPLFPDQTLPVNVIWTKERMLSPVAQTFLEMLAASVKNEQN